MSSYLASCSTEHIAGVEDLMSSYFAGCSSTELIVGIEDLMCLILKVAALSLLPGLRT